jgi:hypothetical protein
MKLHAMWFAVVLAALSTAAFGCLPVGALASCRQAADAPGNRPFSHSEIFHLTSMTPPAAGAWPMRTWQKIPKKYGIRTGAVFLV